MNVYKYSSNDNIPAIQSELRKTFFPLIHGVLSRFIHHLNRQKKTFLR